MNIRALIFDLDNTLVDRDSAHRRYCEDFIRRHALGSWEQERTALLEDLVAEDDSGYRPRKEYFSWVAGALSQSAKHNANSLGLPSWEAEALWNDYRNRISLFIESQPKVNALIESLGSEYILGVISNGSAAGQRNKLERAGLARVLPNIWISEECGCEKPSPQIFLMALKALGCQAAQAVFIGDDPLRDIAGAAAVGCRTCWLSHHRQFPQGLAVPDLVIPSVKDLPQALQCVQTIGKQRGVKCPT